MKNKIIVFLLFCVLLTMSTPVNATTPTYINHKQIIFTIDRLSLEDITKKDMPNLFKIIDQGSAGLMNTNTLGDEDSPNTFLTIADGQGSIGNSSIGRFYYPTDIMKEKYMSEQNAGELYSSLTGWEYKNNKIINPWILSIINDKQNIKNNVKIGQLGKTLNQIGVSSVVIGNSDTNEPIRFAPILTMDQYGRVQDGIIDSSINVFDKSFPFGIRTDYNKVLTKIIEFLPKKDLLIIELGDLYRLEQVNTSTSDRQYNRLRLDTLKKIDGLLNKILPSINLKQDRIIIVSPTPSLKDKSINNSITPVIIAGKGYESGLLKSPSTRRDGLISNIDFSPTVLSFYSKKTTLNNFDGRIITGVKKKDSLNFLSNLDRNLIINYNQRPPILITTAIIDIILIIGSLLVIRFSGNIKTLNWFKRSAIWFLLVPVILLLFRLYRFENTMLSTLILILLVSGLTRLLERTDMLMKFIFIGSITAFIILIDITTGYHLMVFSPLGYDLIVGARYYGLGNEFSGILMGSTILGISSLIQIFEVKGYSNVKKIPILVILLIITGIIYSPFFGADAGGLITALASFGYLFLVLNNIKINNRLILVLALFILIALFGGAALDHIYNSSSQSHIGKAMGQLMQGNFQLIGDILVRKISMNWKLIQFSIWSKVLLAVIIGLTFFTFYPKGILSKIQSINPQLYKGLKAIIVASIVGFIVNDSGLIQAATTSIYIIFPLIYLVIEEKLV